MVDFKSPFKRTALQPLAAQKSIRRVQTASKDVQTQTGLGEVGRTFKAWQKVWEEKQRHQGKRKQREREERI